MENIMDPTCLQQIIGLFYLTLIKQEKTKNLKLTFHLKDKIFLKHQTGSNDDPNVYKTYYSIPFWLNFQKSGFLYGQNNHFPIPVFFFFSLLIDFFFFRNFSGL